MSDTKNFQLPVKHKITVLPGSKVFIHFNTMEKPNGSSYFNWETHAINAEHALAVLRYYSWARSIDAEAYTSTWENGVKKTDILARAKKTRTGKLELEVLANIPDAGLTDKKLFKLSVQKAQDLRIGRTRHKSSRKPDLQRKKLYEWERKVFTATLRDDMFFSSEQLSYEETQALVLKISDLCKIRMPVVHLSQRMRGAHFSPCGYYVKFRPTVTCKWIIIHEVAHAYMYWCDKEDRKFETHGPEFLRVLIELIVRFDPRFKLEDLLKTAREAKLRVADEPIGYLQYLRQFPV